MRSLILDMYVSFIHIFFLLFCNVDDWYEWFGNSSLSNNYPKKRVQLKHNVHIWGLQNLDLYVFVGVHYVHIHNQQSNAGWMCASKSALPHFTSKLHNKSWA